MKKVLRDKNKEALIHITLSLHPSEKNYLLNEADELGERTAVQNILPNVPMNNGGVEFKPPANKVSKLSN